MLILKDLYVKIFLFMAIIIDNIIDVGGVNVATFFTAIFLISSISLIISVVLQDEKSEGLGVLTGEKDSFFGSAKSRGKDYILNRITTISAIVFMISALALVAL